MTRGGPRAGGIDIALIDRDIIECRAWGHINRGRALVAQAEIERVASGRPLDMLYDGARIESFDPGLPMVWVRWSLRRVPKPRGVAVIGRPGPLLSVAGTLRFLLPGLAVGVFADRPAALEFLAQSARHRAGP